MLVLSPVNLEELTVALAKLCHFVPDYSFMFVILIYILLKM